MYIWPNLCTFQCCEIIPDLVTAKSRFSYSHRARVFRLLGVELFLLFCKAACLSACLWVWSQARLISTLSNIPQEKKKEVNKGGSFWQLVCAYSRLLVKEILLTVKSWEVYGEAQKEQDSLHGLSSVGFTKFLGRSSRLISVQVKSVKHCKHTLKKSGEWRDNFKTFSSKMHWNYVWSVKTRERDRFSSSCLVLLFS